MNVLGIILYLTVVPLHNQPAHQLYVPLQIITWSHDARIAKSTSVAWVGKIYYIITHYICTHPFNVIRTYNKAYTTVFILEVFQCFGIIFRGWWPISHFYPADGIQLFASDVYFDLNDASSRYILDAKKLIHLWHYPRSERELFADIISNVLEIFRGLIIPI